MWCHHILKIRTTYNKPVISVYLQYVANNNFDIALKYPTRRLLATDVREHKIGNVIDQWSRRFKSEGIPMPIESIESIVAHVTGTKITDISNLNKNDSLNSSQIEKLESLCKCRLARMPIQYIIGKWNFRDITVKLVPPIFIPWPETEVLVDTVLKKLSQLSSQKDNYEMLEIGCGSGVISLALAHACKKIKCIIAIDTNPDACDLTKINRNNLNLTKQVIVINATLKPDANIEVLNSSNDVGDIDLNSKLFDFVISNPPYVPRTKIPELTPERRIHDDFLAFDGGNDGLKVIKPVLKYTAKALKPGGRLFMEVHISHPEHIEDFLNKYPDLKLHLVQTYKDFCVDGYVVEIEKLV